MKRSEKGKEKKEDLVNFERRPFCPMLSIFPIVEWKEIEKNRVVEQFPILCQKLTAEGDGETFLSLLDKWTERALAIRSQ